MIEKLHRYRTLLVLGLILVAAAFVFGDFYGGRRNSAGGPRSVLGVAGKTYTNRDFQKLAAGPVGLGQMMWQSMGEFATFQFIFELAKGASPDSDMAEKFFVGRVILRNARDEYGIHPSDEEVSAYIRKMRAFADTTAAPNPAGATFDEAKYKEFINKTIGRFGMTENDFLDLAADMLALSKLKNILASGVVADRDTVALEDKLKKQKIAVELARIDLGPFEEKLQPTEEEIKGYWEPIKDAFKTELRRKFSYLVVTPVFPPEPADEDPKESIADAAATDEAKAAAKKKREEEKALKKAKYDDERRAVQRKIDETVNAFYDLLVAEAEKPQGKTFEQLAAEDGYKWEVKTTDLFTAKTPPSELDLSIRASSQGGKAVDQLFQIHPTEDPVSKFTLPIPVGDGQWLIARMDGEEKVREQTFAEARAEARAKLIEEKATAAMKTAAEDALKKIKEAVAGGKPFAEAAKEAGMVESKSITDLTSARRPDAATEPANLFQSASTVDPGAFADVIAESERAFVVQVVKREVTKDPNAETALNSEVTMANNSNETLVFDAWLAAKVEDAKVDQLYKHQ